jgi:hypothetical protein
MVTVSAWAMLNASPYTCRNPGGQARQSGQQARRSRAAPRLIAKSRSQPPRTSRRPPHLGPGRERLDDRVRDVLREGHAEPAADLITKRGQATTGSARLGAVTVSDIMLERPQTAAKFRFRGPAGSGGKPCACRERQR